MSATIHVALTNGEVTGLIDLVAQLRSFFESPSSSDPAHERLAPAAYPDDDDASREFRRLTEGDRAVRRLHDARIVTDTLLVVQPAAGAPDDADVAVHLDPAQVGSWMRTLAAMRLVIASRLGIDASDDHAHDDPAYGIYDWLAYRLETLIEASDV